MRWLEGHRVLVTVYGLAAVLAWAELSRPEVRPGQPDDPRWFLTPGTNIADVSSALHPERAASLYYRAFQAALCLSAPPDAPTACRERGPVATGEVRALLERALATGNESIELALYNYALVLVQEDAPQAEIDAAVRRWRIAWPTSAREDPRVAARKLAGERRPARTAVVAPR